MRQDEFFKILERRLSVIEDSERNDILDEYRQHIAMKMSEGGISEEKAIEDFGDVNALADDILGAYHVRIDASQSTNAIEKSKELFKNVKKETEPVYEQTKSFFARCKDNVLNLFKNLKRKKDERCSKACKKEKNKGEKKLTRFFNMLVFAFYTFVRWCRNIICTSISLVCAVYTAMLLILFGVLLVLVFGGYPLIGAAIIIFGSLLIFGSVTVIFFDLIKRKSKSSNNMKGEEK